MSQSINQRPLQLRASRLRLNTWSEYQYLHGKPPNTNLNSPSLSLMRKVQSELTFPELELDEKNRIRFDFSVAFHSNLSDHG